MIVFQAEIPKICLQTVPDRMAESFLNGVACNTEASGGSVESAMAAKVSMIKLIHKSWTGVSGVSLKISPPINTVSSAEILTVT